jgi:hypothetical protein
VSDAGDLGGDSCERLALEVGVVPISGDIAFILVPEAVLALPDGDLASQPEGPTQSGVTELGDLGLAAELAGLLRRQIEAAELQELAVTNAVDVWLGFQASGRSVH